MDHEHGHLARGACRAEGHATARDIDEPVGRRTLARS
jgi:hypothetical protein